MGLYNCPEFLQVLVVRKWVHVLLYMNWGAHGKKANKIAQINNKQGPE
jgi:hypothetical protein